MEKAVCQHCQEPITRHAGSMTWFDNWYDPRVASICPQRDGTLPHEARWRN